MSSLTLISAVISKFALSALLILILDFSLKIQVQFAWAIALRKRLPLGYGPITPFKIILLINASIAGAIVLFQGCATLNGPMWFLIFSFTLIGVHGFFVYWKEMRDQ